MDKVGIVGYYQVKPSLDINMGRYELIFKAVRGALDRAGLKKRDITSVVSATNDYYDGRTISNCFTVEAGAGYLVDETKVEMDGAHAVLYGLMRALSGNHRLVVVWGGSMPSCYHYSSTTLMTTDPVFERQVETISDLTSGAFQMRAYMEKFSISAEDIAKVAVKNHKNAAKNELALPESQKANCTVDDVLNSEPISTPVTEMMYATPCDSVSCVLLAPEKLALKITDNPVWITGVGYSQENYYLGERDLSASRSMADAAKMAFGAAGVKDPKKEIDVAEIFEHFAHEELILSEAIGLCGKGKGPSLSSDIKGDLPINPSGGAISGNTPCATGLVRIIEAAKQLNGEANGHQVKGVKRAIASGQVGFCAQNSILYVLEGGDN
ncbi:MAG: thiolase family protein [Candidatus Hodarchaeota archaeon]